MKCAYSREPHAGNTRRSVTTAIPVRAYGSQHGTYAARRHARTACKRGHAERLRLPGAPLPEASPTPRGTYAVPRGTYATIRGREASAPVCPGDTQQCQQCPAMHGSNATLALRSIAEGACPSTRFLVEPPFNHLLLVQRKYAILPL